MSGLNGTQARTLPVWQNRVRMRVLSKGSGPALVFFHGPWGLHWDPFLDALSKHFTVHAPEHPGTTPGAPDDVYQATKAQFEDKELADLTSAIALMNAMNRFGVGFRLQLPVSADAHASAA